MRDKSGIAYVIAIAAGIVLWFVASLASGKREAWDAGIYWTVAYPIAICGCGLLGFFFPERPWRWPIALFLGQFTGMALRNGELGNLWPLGLIFFAVLSLPGIVVARYGASLKRQRTGEA